MRLAGLVAAGVGVALGIFSPREKSLLAPREVESAPAPEGIYTDAEIVAILDEANRTDSSAGYYAYSRATSPEVKKYAAWLMKDDHEMRRRDQRVASRFGVVLPMMVADDPIKPAADSQLTELKALASGPGFDRRYVEQEVDLHRSRIQLEQQLLGSTDSQALENLIRSDLDIVQQDLTRGESLKPRI